MSSGSGHSFEVVIRDGRTVCIVIPTQVPKAKVDIIFSLLPDGARASVELSKRWSVWGVLHAPDYRPTTSTKPDGYVMLLP